MLPQKAWWLKACTPAVQEITHFKTCLGYRVCSRPMRAAKEENPHVKQCVKVGWKNSSVALVENWGFVPKTHVKQLTATAFNSSSRGSNALSSLVWPLNSYGQISVQTHNQNKIKRRQRSCACLVCMRPWGILTLTNHHVPVTAVLPQCCRLLLCFQIPSSFSRGLRSL